ncbi:WYL domain-containing protein [Clostridium pasteurianum]|uniref:WYL domain-containing protein n=1 Tax=Clostridium pasteurianum TaxID=1501 RepID=UPI002260FB71|nr:WYL domain-containing protein [Clostridium pasteurianum]UZW14682.1 WYL domain-containing protein [Clostridium pasteurianum]
MELFSEIYNCYYNVITKILNTCSNTPISKEDISKIIKDNAFCESAFYIFPKLIDGDWNLITQDKEKFVSKLKGTIKRPVTLLEKAWLKSLIQDKRISLFLKDEQIRVLDEYLSEIEPLFNVNDFYNYDTFSDGDDYENPEYIRNFRSILSAFKSKQAVTISFESSKGNRITGNYIPVKIEYSNKNDKFRVHTFRIYHGKIRNTEIINIGRVKSVQASKESFNFSLNIDIYEKINKCKEPVVIEISDERNALERCMLNFASFQKHTGYHKDTQKYITYIYYDMKDETELLIRILSFGPVIKVLGPDRFLNILKKRIKRQVELMEI